MNGSTEINDEIYANILSISTNVNSGKWEDLENSSNLLILSETLFIWLDESVKACIYPSKIKEVFESNQLDENIAKFVQGEEVFTKDKYIEIREHINVTLRSYEMEILKTFGSFFACVYPYDNAEVLFEEYHYMVEKVAIFLVGYTIDLLYDKETNEGNNIKNCFLTVERTISLLEFLRKIYSQENIYFNNKQIVTPQNDNDNDNEKNNPIKLQDTLLELNKKEESDISQYKKPTIEPLKIKPPLPKYENEKEKQLYAMYLTLKNHFEAGESKDLSDKGVNIDYLLNQHIVIDKNKLALNNKNTDDFFDSEEDGSSFSNNVSINNRTKSKNESSHFILSKRRSTTKLKYRFPIHKPPESNPNLPNVKSLFHLMSVRKDNDEDNSISLCLKDGNET